ncbi:MAG TPA: antibiotic biosynthesis monooxygenase [Acidimicrobiales bacterium]|nr:antibiotic biosynthesis monooxygenase [Acidimicrobiales bacterium]
MSVVKINAITVPADRADVMAQRFAARAGEVGKADGFEEFQLLRPDDGRTTWLVYTRWRDEEAFEAWRTSQAFGQGHGQHSRAQGGPEGHEGPVATGSELWSYRVEQREQAR